IDLIESLGADELIDYEREDFTQKVKDVDLVFDTVGGETQKKSFGVIRKGGMLVSTVDADAKEAEKHGVKAISFMMVSNGTRLQEIGALADGGLVRVVIEKEFPLAEAKAAQELSQSGHA